MKEQGWKDILRGCCTECLGGLAVAPCVLQSLQCRMAAVPGTLYCVFTKLMSETVFEIMQSLVGHILPRALECQLFRVRVCGPD